MKKIIFKAAFIFIISLAMISCGNGFISKTDECRYSEITEKMNIVSGFADVIMLYNYRDVIYEDSTLRYIEYEDKDSVVKVIAKNLCPMEIKDIYRVTNVDTTFTNIVWNDFYYNDESNLINRVFYDNETKEIVCIINKIERGEEIINDIIDYKTLSKYYSNFKTINDLKNITIVE